MPEQIVLLVIFCLVSNPIWQVNGFINSIFLLTLLPMRFLKGTRWPY